MATDALVELTVEEYFSLSRAGINVRAAHKSVLIDYYATTLECVTGRDVQDLGVDAFVTAFSITNIYTEDEFPIEQAMRAWFNGAISESLTLSMPTSSGSGNKVKKNPESLPTISTGLVPELESDLKAMGLQNGAQITSLSLSIETGQVHNEYDVIDTQYGSDPRLCDVAKQRRKTGLDSLSKLIEAKDAKGIMVHFSSLVRDLNVEGRMQEVSVVTAWMMEVQQTFATDEDGMILYIKEYLRRYRGRHEEEARFSRRAAQGMAVKTTFKARRAMPG